MDAMLTDVVVLPVGSSATQAQDVGDTTVTIEDPTDFAATVDPADADGTDVGTLDICGVQYDYTAVDPSTGVITLASALTVAVAESDPVSVVVGGQVAQTWTATVDPGEGDNLSIPLPFAFRALLPEGHYDPPLPVTVADDLSTIVEVPGRQPVLSQQAVPPAVTDAIDAAQSSADGKNVITYSEDQPGDAANIEGDTWFVFADDGDGNKLVEEQWHGDGGTDWTQVKVDNLLIANLDAGKITAGTLSAIDIDGVTMTGSTITGGTLQTASSGKRVVISDDTWRVRWYDSTDYSGGVYYSDSQGLIFGNADESGNARADYGNLCLGATVELQAGNSFLDLDPSYLNESVLQSAGDLTLVAQGGTVRAPSAFQSGTDTVSVTATNTVYSKTISFSVAFADVPTVTLTPATGDPRTVSISRGAITAAGFVVYMARSSGTGNTAFDWQAMAKS